MEQIELVEVQTKYAEEIGIDKDAYKKIENIIKDQDYIDFQDFLEEEENADKEFYMNLSEENK